MDTKDKAVKIRNTDNKEEANVCVKCAYYFIEGSTEDDCVYKAPQRGIGMCKVYVYETKTLIVSCFEGKYKDDE